jgi:hypothetical protein
MKIIDDGRDLTDELAAAVAFIADNIPAYVVILAHVAARMPRREQLAFIEGNLLVKDKPK